MEDIEFNREANISTNAPRRRFRTSGGNELAKSMRRSLTASISKLRLGEPPTIYKVPERIRQVNNNAYEPKILSIGPYHHGKKSLQGMEDHKYRYLESILSRNSNHLLEDYLEEMEELEKQVRSCYSDNEGHKGNEFVEMMMLDGCFIVELFLKLKADEGDQIFSTIGMFSLIGYDMLLLENQIPFFVLQRIFKMACPVGKLFPYSLADLALYFFDQFMPSNKNIRIKDSYHHLLHLFHSHLIPDPTTFWSLVEYSTIKSIPDKWKNLITSLPGFCSISNKERLPISNNTSRPSPPKMIPCAADLHLSGVKFKKKEKWNSILDVKFSNGVLEIPPLSITGNTDSLLRNLVAFEQCYPDARVRLTAYVRFMDCIVKTSKDVALLHRNGIIDLYLGSEEEVARLFNRLCIGTVNAKSNYLSGLYKDVEEHCQTKWKVLWGSLRRDYFTNPWVSVSSVAAAIILMVAITQTLFAIFSYFLPRPSA